MSDLIDKSNVSVTIEYDTKEHNFLQFTGGYRFSESKGDIQLTEGFYNIEQLDAAKVVQLYFKFFLEISDTFTQAS